MADFYDLTDWKKELRDWQISGEKKWRKQKGSGDPQRWTNMPVELGVRYVRLLLSDPQKMTAIKKKIDFSEKYQGNFDHENLPSDYPHSYGEKVAGFFDWFCWKVDCSTDRLAAFPLEYAAVEADDNKSRELNDKFIISLIKKNDFEPNSVFTYFEDK